MKPIISIFMLLIGGSVFAQPHEEMHTNHEASSSMHKFTLVMGNSLITSHVDEAANAVLVIPTLL